MKTRAVILRKTNQPLTIEEVDLAAPRSGEVLVKIRAAGVCHSDWHLATGDTPHPLPVVLGHEGSGVVEQLGEAVTSIKSGDRVALNWAPSCGACFYCRRGRPALCEACLDPLWAGFMMDGTTRLSQKGAPLFHYSALSCFADHAVVPATCCVKVAEDVPFDVAALIGCAVTTGAGAVLRTVKVHPGSSVAVFGCGGVGLSAIMAAAMVGARPIIAVDVSDDRLDFAKSFGATDVVNAKDQPVAAIKEICDNRGADFAFDATGIIAVQEQCVEAIRPCGSAVMIGLAAGDTALRIPSAKLTRQEKTIVGSYYGSCDQAAMFEQLAAAFRAGRMPLDRLASQRFELEEVNEAYAAMLAGRTARGVIVFPE